MLKPVSLILDLVSRSSHGFGGTAEQRHSFQGNRKPQLEGLCIRQIWLKCRCSPEHLDLNDNLHVYITNHALRTIQLSTL